MLSKCEGEWQLSLAGVLGALRESIEVFAVAKGHKEILRLLIELDGHRLGAGCLDDRKAPQGCADARGSCRCNEENAFHSVSHGVKGWRVEALNVYRIVPAVGPRASKGRLRYHHEALVVFAAGLLRRKLDKKSDGWVGGMRPSV